MALAIRLLGPPRVERDGEAVAFDTRKAMALLAHLALAERPRSREALCSLLWPAHDLDRARGALRRTLSTLRGASERSGSTRPATASFCGGGLASSLTSSASARWRTTGGRRTSSPRLWPFSQATSWRASRCVIAPSSRTGRWARRASWSASWHRRCGGRPIRGGRDMRRPRRQSARRSGSSSCRARMRRSGPARRALGCRGSCLAARRFECAGRA